MHASRGPFVTCARRCALAEGCKYQQQHAGISACISGSVLQLCPEACTCRRLQKRTAARGYKCMHLRVPSSPVPAGVHLQKSAKTEPQHTGVRSCISESVLHLSPEVCTCRRLQKRTAARVIHSWGTVCGGCALAGTANARTLQRPQSLRVCRWGKHQKREMQRLKRVGVIVRLN